MQPVWFNIGSLSERPTRGGYPEGLCQGGARDSSDLRPYGGIWWRQHREALSAQRNLTVLGLPVAITEPLAALASRNMNVQCKIQDGVAWFNAGDVTVEVHPDMLQRPAG